ncbi:MAG: hypothetical protein IKS22_07335 [Bacteroidales bacterium]|nr:hypothetical protein [Bacteroidales bacterium]
MLLYDSPSSSLGGPSYTGLVTRKGETWSIPTGPSPSQVQSVSRAEDYVYDYAARLSAWDDSSNGEDISYDARGNITSRSPRHGSGGTVYLPREEYLVMFDDVQINFKSSSSWFEWYY